MLVIALDGGAGMQVRETHIFIYMISADRSRIEVYVRS